MRLFISTVIVGCLLFSCSPDEQEISNAIHRLEFKRVTAKDKWDSFLCSENENVRRLAVLSVAKIQNPLLLDLLEPLLNDASTGVREAVVFALGQIGGERSERLLISTFEKQTGVFWKSAVINSLGRCGKQVAWQWLNKLKNHSDDALLPEIIRAMAFIYPRLVDIEADIAWLKKMLNSKNSEIRTAAAYFCSRHPQPELSVVFMKVRFDTKKTGEKYRLKALYKSLSGNKQVLRDSIIAQRLKAQLVSRLQTKHIPWQTRYHAIKLLGGFADSLAVEVLAPLLNDGIPHIRAATIDALATMEFPPANHTLMKYYEKAGWRDKGLIIRALSSKYTKLAHRLIQQNLNRGSTYFKQLLLQSLGRIDEPYSLKQLKQFLRVPDKRLQMTAFAELDKRNRINRDDARRFLLSKDLAFTTLAANWFAENPEDASLLDLKEAFSHFKEPVGVEPMQAIIEAVSAINNSAAQKFLQQVFETAKAKPLVESAGKGLEKSGLSVSRREAGDVPLFVADSLFLEKDSLIAEIKTSRGFVKIKLLPKIAPATVGSFVQLARKKFYNGLTFHRVVPDFVVQGGDPRGDGWGGPGYSIPCEYNRHPYLRGTVGMATAGKDTGGSQFFICHSEQPHLNGRYTVFGEVVDGMDVVDNLEIDDKIISVVIKR